MASLSSTASPATEHISAEALAAAAERRTQELSHHPSKSPAQQLADHEKRQKFRRLIDPGILRPNSKEQAAASLQTLLTISENLLREPDNPKFRQFKPTNNVIKRNLMDPKGALEYAIELGFRPEVKDFQPYYTFHSRHLADLEIGAGILRDVIKLENEKTERATRHKKNEKAIAQEAANKVKLAYMDDRKTKMMRDELEREQRAARAASATHDTPILDAESQSSITVNMPGSGHLLSGMQDEAPPSYEHANESDS